MNFPFYIARRYLFSKKSHHVINIISLVSVCGIVVATIALVCTLSIYNGFSGLVSTLFSAFDPPLKITPTTGKVFDPGTPQMQQVRALPSVELFCEVLEGNALVRFKDRQTVGVIKGVSANYNQLAALDSILIDGTFALREDVVDYATLGIGLASTLGANAAFVSPLELFVPKRNSPVNLANPAASSNREYAQIGAVFRMDQPAYDDHYMIVSLPLARSLFDYETEVTSVELKLRPGASLHKTQEQIRSILGENFLVKDRYEQQESSFKMMQVEKWVTFLILCFILMITLFNVVGNMCILMIEKQEDVRTLRNMGANDTLIARIFLFEGWMISLSGALVGIVLGVGLCLLQQQFGLLRMGSAEGTFIIDAYPVKVQWPDIIAVFATVTVLGFVTAWYPVRYLGKKWLRN